jgi:DNA primase
MIYNEGQVEEVLVRLEMDSEQKNRELLALCPMHYERTGKPDNNPSWSINVDTGAHHCFSCGYRGNMLGLICDRLGIDYDQAKRWLTQYTNVDLAVMSARLEEMKNSYIAPTKPVPMSEARLAIYGEPPQWALDARGLTAEACSDYKVKWDSKTSSWITPIRDPHTGALIGWQEKGQGSRYFKNRPAGVAKSTTVFGLEALHTNKTIVVVESPLDVVKMAGWGYYIGVSTYGAIVSAKQLELVSTASNLIFAFDNDSAGAIASKTMLTTARKTGLEYSFFNYGELQVKDIGDMTQEQFEEGLMTAKHCSLGYSALGI